MNKKEMKKLKYTASMLAEYGYKVCEMSFNQNIPDWRSEMFFYAGKYYAVQETIKALTGMMFYSVPNIRKKTCEVRCNELDLEFHFDYN